MKSYPTDVQRLSEVQPVYKTFKGWNSDISGCRTYSDLPSEAKEYLEFIANHTGVKITLVSVGPKREQTFFVA